MKNSFKLPFRLLRRNGLYSYVNIVGLSLGLASVVMVILYVKDEWSYDRFHDKSDSIYRIVEEVIAADPAMSGHSGASSIFHGATFTSSVPGIEAFTRLKDDGSRDIQINDEIVSHRVLMVDENFFQFFTFPLLYGDPGSVLKDPGSVVISEDVAQNYFGGGDVLGKSISVKRGKRTDNYIVAGIAKRAPTNSSIKFDFLIAFVSDPSAEMNDLWLDMNLNTFLRVAPGANTHEVEGRMQETFTREAGAILEKVKGMGYDVTFQHHLQRFTDVHLSEVYGPSQGLTDGSRPAYSLILSLIAVFILVIGSINFINLTIAQSVKRAKEIAVRKMVGGSRRQLIAQSLVESFTYCILASLLALLIVYLVLPRFNETVSKNLELSSLADPPIIVAFILLIVITGLMSGIYPAIVLSSSNPVQGLLDRSPRSTKKYLQKGLVLLQFSLATTVCCISIIVYKQFTFLTTKDLGYDYENVFYIVNPNLDYRNYLLMRDELKKAPSVEEVAAGAANGIDGKINDGTVIHFLNQVADESYIPVFRIKLVAGRGFSDEFPADSLNGIIVNETFVRMAGWKEPIGEEVNLFPYSGMPRKVIGVVKDYHFGSLNEEIGPMAFTMPGTKKFQTLVVRIRPGTETETIKTAEIAYKKIFPGEAFKYGFMDNSIATSYDAVSKWKLVMWVATVFTIFISCIGMLGLSLLDIEQRLKEISIRKTLGASTTTVVVVLSKQFIILTTAAVFVAIPFAIIAANKWLQTYAYKIDLTVDIFIIAGAAVLAVAFLTVSFQAIRASASSPVRWLR